MNAFRKMMYKVLSSGVNKAEIPAMSVDDMLMKVAEDTPELREWIVKLADGEVSQEEFNRICTGQMVKELYAFRKEEENSRMQAW